jgi:uncharacterized protein YdhG (YjbR/CyaY superfamily)
MNRGKPVERRSAAGKNTPKTVDEYLAGIPEPARSTLQKVRAALRSAAPADAVEIISYRIPALKLKRVLVWYAAFANHCSLFPTAAVIASFKKELAGFKTARGTIQFPTDKPLPTALMKRIVKARVAQIESKKRR